MRVLLRHNSIEQVGLLGGGGLPYQAPHSPAPRSIAAGRETARFLQVILLSHASHACDHTHTPIHTHTLQTIEATGQIPTPPAYSTPLGTRTDVKPVARAAL